ncbi:MAG: ATP-dependent helicase HrpB, partial [Rhodothermales bacterium]|nr:ATP-dependent helicase HrpB [Rhodothermales bacterium]
MKPEPLPIDAVLPDLRAALRAHAGVVLQAPPGAGKTTRVPLALLGEPWLAGQRLVMLEPRRLAARAAARRMAHTLGERVGQTVGYRVRMDTRVGDRTRVEVVTEGVLTRMLQEDASLAGVGAVVFDEYHERSLHADLGLALCLEAQAVLRPDLKLLVMSATLAGERVARLLGGAPVIASEGRLHPVETHYLDHRPEDRPEAVAVRAVRQALAETEGDVLVFLPGAGEIRRAGERLREGGVPAGTDVAPLHGRLPLAEQDRAIAPAPPGRRKVVLSTDIAETSLTIEGIRTVVDSGWMRVPRFDPGSGMTRLATIRVSAASAEQRRGRAGRLGPGACYRLWTRHTQHHLHPFSPAEILHADLAPLALELARWGTPDPGRLRWLDPPPAAAYAQARDLLRALGALGADGGITRHGRHMAALPVHPRLAHMILRARPYGLAGTACDLAALLTERDVLRGRDGAPEADLRLRLEVLRHVRAGRRGEPPSAFGQDVDRRAVRRVLKVADHWRRRFGGQEPLDAEAAGVLTAFAYPDRLAQRRAGTAGRFRLRNGRAAVFEGPQLLSEAPFVVAAHHDGPR